MGPGAAPGLQAAERARRRGGSILGVDPGLRRTGYAIVCGAVDVARARVVEAGTVQLRADWPLERRLLELERCLGELVAVHRPAAIACERLYSHYRHPRTAILMAHARGVILVLAARRGLPAIAVSATQAKKLLTGSGRAGKQQVQRAVAATLGLDRLPEPHDVADALALALCGLHLRNLGRAAPAAGAPR